MVSRNDCIEHLRAEEFQLVRRIGAAWQIELSCSSSDVLSELCAFISPDKVPHIDEASPGRISTHLTREEWRQMCIFTWKTPFDPKLSFIADPALREQTRRLCQQVHALVRASMPVGCHDISRMTPRCPPTGITHHVPQPPPPVSSPPQIEQNRQILGGERTTSKAPVTSPPQPKPRLPSNLALLLDFLPALSALRFGALHKYADGFIVKEVRHPTLIDFTLQLKASGLLQWEKSLPAEIYPSQTTPPASQKTILKWVVRLQQLYWNKSLLTPTPEVMDELLTALQALSNIFVYTPRHTALVTSSLGQMSISALEDSDRSAIWEGDTKYLGYMARDHGQFGSISLYDLYDDESNAQQEGEEIIEGTVLFQSQE